MEKVGGGVQFLYWVMKVMVLEAHFFMFWGTLNTFRKERGRECVYTCFLWVGAKGVIIYCVDRFVQGN